ncbi:hypothetical protein BC830DRAFT_1168146 [Chytriomyces sp. MP71]|nr:hypothetical protein BC830DRAFT_1168146 [Chytriomyces sp. MP71]
MAIVKDSASTSNPKHLLADYEQSPLLADQEAIVYATFYTGTVPLVHLRERVSEIVRLNPVLAGHFVRTLRGIAVQVPKDFSLVRAEDHFVVQDTDITNDTRPLGPALPLLVECNRIAIRKKTSLFKVAVLVNRALNQFCLVMAVSHLLADGATFYTLLSMLDKNSEPRALTFNLSTDNANNLEGNAAKVIPSLNYMYFRVIPHFTHPIRSTIAGIAARLIALPSFVHTDAWRWQHYEIPSSWIQSQKAAAMATKPDPNAFVSTNDCLVSWFLSTTRVAFAGMYLNLRGRVPELTPDHAGNYMRALVFQRGDFETPWLVRGAVAGGSGGAVMCATLREGRRFRAPKVGDKLGVVSNVCGLFRKVELPGECEFLEHHYTLRDSALGIGTPYCTLYSSKPGNVCMLTNIAFGPETFA